MDHKHDEIFSKLRSKIKLLITMYEAQKLVNSELEEKNKELANKLLSMENEMEVTNKKIENLKVAKVLNSINGEDAHHTKIQVNKIVREIDKCIALLNK